MNLSTNNSHTRASTRRILRIARFRELPGFSRLDSTTLERITSWVTWHRIRRDRPFCPSSADADDLYIVVEGELGMPALPNQENPGNKFTLGNGNLFFSQKTVGSKIKLLSQYVGVSDGVAARISWPNFLKIIEFHPEFTPFVISNLRGTNEVLLNFLGHQLADGNARH
jgi:hypothetical protein